MQARPVCHNSLITNFLSGPKLTVYADFDVAEIFSGRFDQSTQIALRHRLTQRVRLVDLNRDGTVTDNN